MRKVKDSAGACAVEYLLLLAGIALFAGAAGNFISSLQGSSSPVSRFAALDLSAGGGSAGSGGVDSGGCDFTSASVMCSGTSNVHPD